MLHTSGDACRKRVITPPFVVAVVLLGAAAILAGPVSWLVDFRQVKEALPLRASLSTLRAESLWPYEVVRREVLPPAVVEALGTKEYLSWTLRDTSVPADDPLYSARLLVTYYTGGHALVPHTPDVCFLGSGYEPTQAHENTEITLASLEPERATVPIRVCSFGQTAVFNRKVTTVIYTFFCNGKFTAGRNAVRFLTHDPSDTHAFFSKVEVGFPAATREQNIEGVQKLFDRVIPVLMSDHWPDFEAAERAADERSDTP